MPTHGGSLRVWAQHAANPRPVEPRVAALLAEEDAAGMRGHAFYQGLQARADAIKHDLLAFLIEQKRAGRTVAAYGAAAKGCTLLNYAGVRPDLLPFVVDASPHKQGRFLPGSRIPVLAPEALQHALPGLRADPALEPARGDRRRPRCGARLGRPVRHRGAGAADLLGRAPPGVLRSRRFALAWASAGEGRREAKAAAFGQKRL